MTHCHSSGTKQNLQTKTKSWNHKKSTYILPANPRINKPLQTVCVCVCVLEKDLEDSHPIKIKA